MTFRNQFIILKITMHNRPFFINIHQWLTKKEQQVQQDCRQIRNRITGYRRISKWFCTKRLWQLVKSSQSWTKLSENKKKCLQFIQIPSFPFCRVFWVNSFRVPVDLLCNSMSHVEKATCYSPKPIPSSRLCQCQKSPTLAWDVEKQVVERNVQKPISQTKMTIESKSICFSSLKDTHREK